MTYNVSFRGPVTRARQPVGFWVAAIAGAVHTAITVHWGLGGHYLLWTMGASFIEQFRPVLWLLLPVALMKAAGAFGPLWLQSQGWPRPRVTRPLYWLAAAVLIVWGGLNTLVGNAVLLGLVHPAEGYDRPVMIGHAWLWDPIFLIWGLGMLQGLLRTRAAVRGRHT